MTYREVVYMCIDEIKGMSDDATYSEESVIFLINKYRMFLLKQRYSDIRKPIPESNYQTVCLDLVEIPAISGEACGNGSYLRSKRKVPFLSKIYNPEVYPTDFYQGEITYVSKERMKYVGMNKYLQNIIYCSLGPDNYLYFKSSNPQHKYLERVQVVGIFEDALAASELQCPDENGDIICDILDRTFPIEDSLVPPMIELVVKELLGAEYRPKDESNDAKDGLSEVATK